MGSEALGHRPRGTPAAARGALLGGSGPRGHLGFQSGPSRLIVAAGLEVQGTGVGHVGNGHFPDLVLR